MFDDYIIMSSYTIFTHTLHFPSPFQYSRLRTSTLISRDFAFQEAVAVMVLAFVPSFVPMIFLRAMSGFFMASLRPVCNALVADAWTTKQKIKGRLEHFVIVLKEEVREKTSEC